MLRLSKIVALMLLFVLWVLSAQSLWSAVEILGADALGRSAVVTFGVALYIVWLMMKEVFLVPRSSAYVGRADLKPSVIPRARLTLKHSDEVRARVARHEAAHAVVAHELGARILSVDVRPVGERGGQCIYTVDKDLPVVDVQWIYLVSAMAGHLQDLSAGVHDDGSQSDLSKSLLHAAAIRSTGTVPAGVVVDLTTDALLDAAATRARGILASRAIDVEQLAGRLQETGCVEGPFQVQAA